MIRILQHREKCIGCHACVDAAPQRWRVSRRDGVLRQNCAAV